jgi:hypothetical protein
VNDPAGDLDKHLTALVDVARRKLANLDARRDLDTERDRVHWDLTNTDGLNSAAAARAIRARLLAEGFTEAQIRAVGVSEHTIKPIARLPRKP